MPGRRALVAGLALVMLLVLSGAGGQSRAADVLDSPGGAPTVNGHVLTVDDVTLPEPPPLTEPRQNPRWTGKSPLLLALAIFAVGVVAATRRRPTDSFPGTSPRERRALPSQPRAPPFATAG